MPSTLLSSRNERSSTETKRTSWPRRCAASARWIVAKVGCCSRTAATTKQTLTSSRLRGRERRAVAAQDVGQAVERQRGRDVARGPAHLVGHAERVDDRLLGALDGRLVERVAGLVEQHLELGGHERRDARHDVG